jgi:hypothetical protein
MDMKKEPIVSSSRLWKFRKYRTWVWMAFLFTLPMGIIATVINLVALIITDMDFIHIVEDLENDKKDHTG